MIHEHRSSRDNLRASFERLRSGAELSSTCSVYSANFPGLPCHADESRRLLRHLKKYHTFTKQLQVYADSRGYAMLDQFHISDMDHFYTSWNDEKRSRAKKLERLKSFVKFCLKRKWMTEDIEDDLRAPESFSIPPNKMPFTDEELNRIYKACDEIGGPKPPGPGHRACGGEDVRDFVMLSIYSGLRISDVSTFNIADRLKGDDVFLWMHKTQKELYTWIPDWLVARLKARERQHGALISAKTRIRFPLVGPGAFLLSRLHSDCRRRTILLAIDASPTGRHPIPSRKLR